MLLMCNNECEHLTVPMLHTDTSYFKKHPNLLKVFMHTLPNTIILKPHEELSQPFSSQQLQVFSTFPLRNTISHTVSLMVGLIRTLKCLSHPLFCLFAKSSTDFELGKRE